MPTYSKLTWSHYRALLEVKDEPARSALEKQAEKESWSFRELEQKISETAGAKKRSAEKKTPSHKFISKRGRLGTYRMDEEDFIDLGFSVFFQWQLLEDLVGFKQGDILELTAKNKLVKLKEATAADLYTYKAKVARVVDGDTIWAEIGLGFKIFVRQKLRLRGIDTPEINTAAGQRAKRFVESQFKSVPYVIVTTTKPDKYDRYLSDVWIGDVNLNKLLLDKGLATLKTEVSESDWDDDSEGRF